MIIKFNTFHSILTLTLFLCNSISSESTENVATNIENGLSNSEYSRFKLKFTNLNEDVQFLIFDCLGFVDLMNLVVAIPNTYALAHEFVSKYEVRISDVFQSWKPKSHDNTHLKRIDIHDIDFLVNVLKIFGKSIRKIDDLTHYGDANRLAIISQSINEYGSESLTHLKLGNLKEDAFEQFIIPFERLEELQLTMGPHQFKNGSKPMNDIFPNLRSLKMNFKLNFDYSYFVCEFPMLIEVDGSIDIWEQLDQIDAFLKRNKQIKALHMLFRQKDYAQFLSENLPNLEILSLNDFNVGGDAVRLDNVKHFKLNSFSPNVIDKLTLPRLEYFHMKYSMLLFDSWLGFFKNHRTLKRLHVNVFNRERNVRLDELTAELPHLVDMSIECISCVNAQMIIQIIENHKDLMRFQFLTLIPRDNLNILWQRFDNEWNIQNITSYHHGLFFQRKI